jgi:hypothetical protein
MREILLCSTAFLTSLVLGLSWATVTAGRSGIVIDKSSYEFMDCVSLEDNNYTVEIDGREHRAAASCGFGGYIPLGPRTPI